MSHMIKHAPPTNGAYHIKEHETAKAPLDRERQHGQEHKTKLYMRHRTSA